MDGKHEAEAMKLLEITIKDRSKVSRLNNVISHRCFMLKVGRRLFVASPVDVRVNVH